MVVKLEDAQIKNALALLHMLLKQDGVSRVGLSRTTRLTKITILISDIAGDFISSGRVEEVPAVPTGNAGGSTTPH